MKKPKLYVIAGPNGSGKTTFARKFLPNYAKCQNFINADLIAQGLAPFSPQNAALKSGRLVLEQINNHIQRRVDFAFETTLAGKSYCRLFRDLRKKNYHLYLFFLWIPSAELALARIRDRVAEGGHNVPEVDVKRRFNRGIYNLFKLYKPLLDSWMLFDNSQQIPQLVVVEENDQLRVEDKKLYDAILKKVRQPHE